MAKAPKKRMDGIEDVKSRDDALYPKTKKQLNRPLTDMKSKFIELYVTNHDDRPLKELWIEAGHSPNNAGHSVRIWMRENHKRVTKHIHERIGGHVVFAINGIVELAKTARNESVKLKALQDIMGRAGFDKALEIITSEKKAGDLTNEDLEKEIQSMMDKSDKTIEEDKVPCH